MALHSRIRDGLRPLRRRLDGTRQENGFVLVFSALFITVLIALGGFAVDVGNWYLQAWRLQRAADSAALAGSVHLPNDFVEAEKVAEANLDRNFAPDDRRISQSDIEPTRLKVELSDTAETYFSSLIGVGDLFVTRQAVAEYRPYVPMGSPSNLLGLEPPIAGSAWEKASTRPFQKAYWLNISGTSTAKTTGDRFSSGSCSGAPDNCDTTKSIPFGNLDYSDAGQIFVVRVPPGTTGTLAVEAFDPGFTDVGDDCTSSTLNGADAFDNVPNLYARGSQPHCTGDSGPGSRVPDTSFTMYTPEDRVGGSQPVTSSSCSSRTFPGYKGSIVDKVDPGRATYDQAFVDSFRRWVRVCEYYVDADNGGDYVLHVHPGSVAGTGLNRYALRAAIVDGSGTPDVTKTDKVQLFSKGRLVVYAREDQATVEFYLARIYSGAAGHTMTVTLYDIGDAAGGATLQLLPAVDARNGASALTAFGGCKYMKPKTTNYVNTASNCRIENLTSGAYNGRLVNIQVPLPGGYRCDDSEPEGCWARLKITYGAGKVNDTTSWEVSLNGAPVHLVLE